MINLRKHDLKMKSTVIKLIIRNNVENIVVCSLLRISKTNMKIKYMNEEFRNDVEGSGEKWGKIFLKNLNRTFYIISNNSPAITWDIFFICGRMKMHDFDIISTKPNIIKALFEERCHYIGK